MSSFLSRFVSRRGSKQNSSKLSELSRRAICSAIETLELRRLMSVEASTLIGPTTVGDSWTYQFTDSSNTVTGEETSTIEPSTTFNGISGVGDRRTVNTSPTTGDTITSDDYTGTTADGIVDYGSTDTTKNASGGVISTSTDTFSPADLTFPASITAGVTYSTTYTDTYTATYDGTTEPPSSNSETDTLTLSTTTPTPTESITVPAGTYNTYLFTATTSTVSDGTTTTDTTQEYLAPGVGLIEVTGSNGGTSFADKLVSAPADSSGGGGDGGGGGGITTTGSLKPLVTKTTLPGSVVAGGTTRGAATVTLTNSSASNIKESVTTKVFASADGLIDGSSVQIGSLTKTVEAKSGGDATVTVPIPSLPASLNGTYTLLAEETDTTGSTDATTGPTLVAAAPFVQFSNEAITTNLTGSVVSGSKTKDTVSLTLTNNGNIASTGSSSVELLVSPDGTAASGTMILTSPEAIVLKPGKSKTVKIPLKTLPNVANGTYDIVAVITDPKGNVTTTVTPTTVNLAQAFLTLTPALSAITPGVKGTGSFTLTITNNGNIPPAGASQLTLYASTTTTVTGAAVLKAQKIAPLQPGKSKTLKFKLTAAQLTQLTTSGFLVAAVVDPLGGTQTASTPAGA